MRGEGELCVMGEMWPWVWVLIGSAGDGCVVGWSVASIGDRRNSFVFLASVNEKEGGVWEFSETANLLLI